MVALLKKTGRYRGRPRRGAFSTLRGEAGRGRATPGRIHAFMCAPRGTAILLAALPRASALPTPITGGRAAPARRRWKPRYEDGRGRWRTCLPSELDDGDRARVSRWMMAAARDGANGKRNGGPADLDGGGQSDGLPDWIQLISKSYLERDWCTLIHFLTSSDTILKVGLHTTPLFGGRQGSATDKTPY